MDPYRLALHVGIALFSLLALACFSRLFKQRISDILGTFFALLLKPFWNINDALLGFYRDFAAFYHGQFLVNDRLDPQQVFFQFIGAVLYTIFFLGFNFSELHLLALALTAVGIDAGTFNSPIGAGTLTALALLACFLFWGSIVLDLLGVTNTAPWRESLNKKQRRYLFCVAVSSLSLSLFVTSSMGLYRGKVIADESLNLQGYVMLSEGGLSDSDTEIFENYPTPSEQTSNETSVDLNYWIPIIANVCIPILVGIGGVFAGWGVVILIKYLILMAGFLMVCPLGLVLLVSKLYVNIVDRLYQFVDAMFQLLAAIGDKFMGIFGWRPPESDETENYREDESSKKVNKNDSQSKTPESERTDQEEEQPNPPEDGWDPFKNDKEK